MYMKTVREILVLFLTVSLAVLAHAQTEHPVTVVVPFSAGSAQDGIVRLISDRLGKELQAPVVVVNKPGAGGTVGAALVAQAKSDGYTYLLASSSHHLAGALHQRLTYQPLGSFRGAAFLGFSEYVLVSAEVMKVADLNSFVARVQSQLDHFYYASSGNGSVTHIAMASFLDKAGLRMTHIPLKGTGEIFSEILAGRVQAAMVSTFSAQAYMSDLRLNFLAITDKDRSERYPDLPTISESGYPHFMWLSWVGLLAPAAAPQSKIQEVNRALGRVMNDPLIKNRFNQLGIASKAMTLENFDALLKDEWRKASLLIRQSKVIVD